MTTRILPSLLLAPLLLLPLAPAARAQSSAAADVKLSLTDATADFAKLRAAYEALDQIASPEDRKAAFDKLKLVMADYAKAYDGKLTEGPPLVGLGLANRFAGDADKGQKIMADYQQALNGKPAPSLEVWKALGVADSWSLADLKGKVVLVDFWATWCPPCRGSIPGLIEISNEYGEKGLQVIGATQLYGRGWLGGAAKNNLDQAAELKLNEDFKTEQKVSYPIVFCKKNTAMFHYAVTGIPTAFLVDRTGKIRWSAVGGGDHSALKKKLEELLAEAAPQ